MSADHLAEMSASERELNTAGIGVRVSDDSDNVASPAERETNGQDIPEDTSGDLMCEGSMRVPLGEEDTRQADQGGAPPPPPPDSEEANNGSWWDQSPGTASITRKVMEKAMQTDSSAGESASEEEEPVTSEEAVGSAGVAVVTPEPDDQQRDIMVPLNDMPNGSIDIEMDASAASVPPALVSQSSNEIDVDELAESMSAKHKQATSESAAEFAAQLGLTPASEAASAPSAPDTSSSSSQPNPPPPPPPAPTVSSSPKRTNRKPPMKQLKEEDNSGLDSSDPGFTGESTHQKGDISEEKLNEIRDSMGSIERQNSARFSISSVPCTQDETIKRGSRHGAANANDAAAAGFSMNRSNSHETRNSFASVNSAATNGSTAGRMWNGIKRKITGPRRGANSSRSPPRTRSYDVGGLAIQSERPAHKPKSPTRSKFSSLARSTLGLAPSHAAVTFAQQTPLPLSSSTNSTNNNSYTNPPAAPANSGRSPRALRTAGLAKGARAQSPTPPSSSSAQAPFRRANTSPVRGGGRTGRLQDNSEPVSSNRGRNRRGSPHRGHSRSRSASPMKKRPSIVISRDINPSSEDLEKLEKVGKALKDGLTYTTVTDRMKKKTYDRCFDGSAAVDFLCQHLRQPRPEALHVGRELVRHFGLFINATGHKFHSHNGSSKAAASQHNSFMLQDSTTAHYRMVGYLPFEVKRMNIETKLRIFEEGVSVKTRRQGLRKYKKCFVGAEAINFLVRSRIVQDRTAAVTLGKKFVAMFNLFEPVNRIHDFQDSRTRLYRFVEKKKRYFPITNMLSTRLIQMGQDDTDLSHDDGGSSIGGKSSISGSTVDSDEEQDQIDDDQDGMGDSITVQHQKLFDVADIMERGIKVTDNTKKASGKKGTSYKDTFVAARAVTFMVTSGLASTREEATSLGRKLERELNLFTEVGGKHDFSDANHYFRFTDKKDRFAKPIKAEKPLNEVAELFEQGVKVKDYMYRMRTYKKTFIGNRAVDFLVNSRLASSRANAVRLGSQLVAEFNLFERVTGNKEFCDDQCYFRFTPPEKRKTPAPVQAAAPKRRSGRAFLLNRSAASRASLVAKDIPEELLRCAENFLNGVKVKEHKFRAKPYRQTFVGSDAVSFMVDSSLAPSRKEAVDLGKKLTVDVGLFLGIDGKKDFKDDYLLYRFSERFEEQLHSGSDEGSTLLRGLISGVSGNINVKSLPLEKIAEAFRNGVKVDDHKEKSKNYKDTFVGSEAVDFLVGSGISESRVEAVDLGRSLAREFSLFEHIHKDCEFDDEDFLYKFCYEGEIRPLDEIEIEISRLMNIAKDFELCVKTKVNKFRLTKYNNTFLGTDAVDYLVNSCTATSRKEAVQIGRAITKEFNLFEHVTNDRKFQDANIPYFFVKNDERYKGLNLEKKRARRNIFDCSDDDESSLGSAGMGESSHMNSSKGGIDLTFDTEDKEWANKMATFERRMHNTASYISTKNMNLEGDESSQSTTEVRKEKMQKRFHEWASKFHRLDPRYQIRYFFDFVAQDGAEDAEARVLDADNLRALYHFLPSRAQVFTVWRPTSADAIKKMMKGEAVGKGLDVKGKSAKRGKLSGFVPFLQIGENKHKSKIRPPSKEGVVRVFYPGEARRGRDLAAEKLERCALEMIETVEAAKKILDDNESSKSARKDALDSMLLDMGPDPSIEYIDDYAPNRYGLEIPERLFWEAFFNQQDITRKAGSEYDTGRPSQPAFQDMNFAAIRAEPKENAPRAVVYQGADPDSPMNPFELLVAYEENSRVMPVVSDFDCFLVGTKRVAFESPLPDEQLNVLKWYVKEIENVMKTSKVGDSWTVNWLEILKKAAREGFYPEMPRFGFGDPKSYSIMENAVSRLAESGAVRHGAECFNYYFPQDLDDEFLVIANDLPNKKPWAYVDVEGLQDILEEKIGQGFTFPLNPKWVLCDSFRWKELYDQLMSSDKLETQQSMKIWFPPDSGLREIIERVHKSRPHGFYKGDPNTEDDDSDSDSDANGGAGAKETMMSTVVALRLLEKFQQRTKQYQSGGESNDDESNSES